MPSITHNQRREPRIDVCVPVTVFRGKKAITLETSDVSYKGLFLRTNEPPALRSLVRLKVSLMDRELEAHAMAVHVVGESDDPNDRVPGVGLQFWGLAGANRSAWDDFVRNLVLARRAAAKAANASTAPLSQSGAVSAVDASGEPSGMRMIDPRLLKP